MNCLKDYIGISPSVGVVESNLYLTDLAGITLNNLEKIAEQKPEQEDFKAVFKDCEKRALMSFVGSFTASINECYHICDIDIINCLICENKKILGGALWYLIGAEYMIERIGSDRLNRFTTIDRKKAKEFQDFFAEKFAFELQNAVRSIDPNKNDCVDSEVIEPKQLTDFIEFTP